MYPLLLIMEELHGVVPDGGTLGSETVPALFLVVVNLALFFRDGGGLGPHVGSGLLLLPVEVVDPATQHLWRSPLDSGLELHLHPPERTFSSRSSASPAARQTRTAQSGLTRNQGGFLKIDRSVFAKYWIVINNRDPI
jgi:hypothetical protein